MTRRKRVLLDVDELAPGENEFHLTLAPAELDASIPELAGPVEAEVRLTKMPGKLRVVLTVDFPLRYVCSRCGEDVQADRHEAFQGDYLLVPPRSSPKPVELKEEELYQLYLVDSLFDLRAPIRDTIILSIPMAPLCRPNCPGC